MNNPNTLPIVVLYDSIRLRLAERFPDVEANRDLVIATVIEVLIADKSTVDRCREYVVKVQSATKQGVS